MNEVHVKRVRDNQRKRYAGITPWVCDFNYHFLNNHFLPTNLCKHNSTHTQKKQKSLFFYLHDSKNVLRRRRKISDYNRPFL